MGATGFTWVVSTLFYRQAHENDIADTEARHRHCGLRRQAGLDRVVLGGDARPPSTVKDRDDRGYAR
jgi:hypothetical protein